MGKYFGTDGFRGEVGTVLTAAHAFRVGRFLGSYYKKEGGRARVAVGRDTRLCSQMLEHALVAGLLASGADAYLLGVTVTPNLAFSVAQGGFDGGVMLTASHNPYTEGGIKLVDARGEKAEDGFLAALEAYLDRDPATPDLPYAVGEGLGRAVDFSAGRADYFDYLLSLPDRPFTGCKVALDCANGSAYLTAGRIFEALGARTYMTGASPDGLNINRGVGSTHIGHLSRFVREVGADIGFAFDGDGDRCIAVDAEGEEVDGDRLLYLLALRMKKQGQLPHDTVVLTVMSNLGLCRALEEAGIAYKTTAVGDRYVAACMKEGGYGLGGEQSGHIILSRYAGTGDGILTALKVTEAVLSEGRSLRELTQIRLYPQVQKNIRVRDAGAVVRDSEVLALVREVETALAGRGRVILRASGTEPVVRVMLEAEDGTEAAEFAEKIAARIHACGYGEAADGNF